MNTKHLEYILQVYYCGSINKAAKYCYISQSYLSKIIKDIENEIGVSIMDRSRAGLIFTPAGHAFVEHAQKIVAESERIYHLAEHLGEEQSLSIACSPDAFLLHSFLDYERHFSADRSSDLLRESGLREIIHLVRSGNCQLGIMAMFERQSLKYQRISEKNGLHFSPIKLNIPMIAVMNSRHPLAQCEGVCVEDFSRYPIAVDGNVDHDDTLGVLNIPPTHQVLYVTGLSCMLVALKENNYMTMEMQTMQSFLSSNDLCSRPIQDLPFRSGIYFVRPEKAAVSNREKQFLAFLEDKLKHFL